MRFQFFQPSGILSRYIRHYWILEADASEGEITERVIPTGNIELMFHYGLPFHVKRSEAKSDSQPRSFVSGISSTYSDVSSSGETGVIAVTFFPFGACNFFRFPLDEIQNSTVSLRQIYSSSFKFIEEKISEVPLINDRIKIIEEFLTKHLHPINPNDFSFLKQSLALINSSRGVITATELSQQLCLSSKSLERKFTHFLGKTPKQFLKIIRFQEILKSLSAGDNILLTEIAYEKGYFDQAHFIKDFKMYTGYTPREFVAIYPCNSGYSGSEYF